MDWYLKVNGRIIETYTTRSAAVTAAKVVVGPGATVTAEWDGPGDTRVYNGNRDAIVGSRAQDRARNAMLDRARKLAPQ